MANETAYALSGSGNYLISFDLAAPSTGTIIAINGLTVGDALVGIDFRPVNGVLYGLGVNDVADTVRLYTISTQTGQATAVGSGFSVVGLPAGDYGFDFNPTVDRIRVTTSTDLNFRVNPDTGGLVATDGAINVSGGGDGAVSASAYTNNFAGASVTTLYTLDAVTNQLFTQIPPNNGTLNLVGSLGVDFSEVNGFDIAKDATTGLAALTVLGVTALYSIDLNTGAATKISNILTGGALNGLSINSNDAPNDIALSSSSVKEFRAAGTVVGALSTADFDAGDTFAYTLLDSAGGRFAISGNQLVVANGVLLDFEQSASHLVTVRVTDAGGLFFDEVLTISVADVNPEIVNGDAAANTIFGGALADKLFGLGGNDTLRGQGGNDTLTGGLGKDTMLGGIGFDKLIGGLGRDVMTGGGHRDIFDFNLVGETGKTFLTRDVIKDFSHAQHDAIDVSTIDAKAGVPLNQKFTFIGQGAFAGVKGQLHYKFAGANTIVEGDINGDKIADFQIELTGHRVLVDGDFIL